MEDYDNDEHSRAPVYGFLAGYAVGSGSKVGKEIQGGLFGIGMLWLLSIVVISAIIYWKIALVVLPVAFVVWVLWPTKSAAAPELPNGGQ